MIFRGDIMHKRILGMCTVFLLLACSQPPKIDKNDRLIVIDAGHGGHDSGAIGDGLYEKDLVLQIAQKTASAFQHRGYKVHLTRDGDNFIKLSGRTKIADQEKADIFISIHANAVGNKKHFATAEGIETYFLQKTRDARSQGIAAKENAAVLQGTDGLSKHVIIDSVLNGPKIIESNKLAIDVQNNIMQSVKSEYNDVKDGGVRPAPFYVLVGASRPSILVEVGYITNPKERARLFSEMYQENIAKGIVLGATKYLNNRKTEVGF